MSDEEKKKRKKKKGGKKKKRSSTAVTTNNSDSDENNNTALLIDQGEAEFANNTNEPILVANANGDEEAPEGVITLVQQDDNLGEDAIPAPIVEPDQQQPQGDVQMFSEDGLAVAMAVDTAAEDEYIYSAIEYDPDSKPPLHKNRRFRVYTCLAISIVIAVVAIVVVYVTKSAKGDEVTNETIIWDNPTGAPTPAPISDREMSGIIEQIEAGVLQRTEGGLVNFTHIKKTNLLDPRYLALDWILHHDELQLESDDKNLYQRYVLALLAFSLDSLAWYACGEHRTFGNVTTNYKNEDCEVQNKGTGQIEEHKVWLSSTMECSWYGVICSSDDVVRGVELIGNDLIGEIPPEISQLRFLQYLALNGNCLYGTIPPEFGKMPNLLSLELHGNGLSGELPSEMYDASKIQLLNVAMQYQYAFQCQMSNGTLVNTLYERGGVVGEGQERVFNAGLSGKVLGPAVNKWTSMKGLHLFDNSFYGNMTDNLGDLKYLVFLRAHNNVFSGMVPAGLTRLEKLREVYLSKNELWSDLPPDIGLMEDLEDIRVNENEMFGKIPESLYDLSKLKKLWLQDTLHCEQSEVDGWTCDVTSDHGFDGTISSGIGNLKKLSQLLLSNNPLSGELPSEIGNCEELAILHMHKTNIEGSVPRELCLLRDKNLNNEMNEGIFYADCRPNNKTQDPFFACDCCTDCCDHTTQVCIADD